MKKMAENIKLTRDAQSPDEPKANEVRNAVQISVEWWFEDFTSSWGTGFAGNMKALAQTFLWSFRESGNCEHCLYVANIILSEPILPYQHMVPHEGNKQNLLNIPVTALL